MITIPELSNAGGALIASPSAGLRSELIDRLNHRCRPVEHALGGAEALAKLDRGGWCFSTAACPIWMRKSWSR
jgi:hypothetical protein